MMKAYGAYMICDNRKFKLKDDAIKELERIRSLCYRLKAKSYGITIVVILGVSVVSTDYLGKMGYLKPKSQGGKKEFICSESIKKIDRTTGKVIRVKPPISVSPHIHIMVDGLGASSYSEDILNNLKKRNPNEHFSKSKLKNSQAIAAVKNYIESQSIVYRTV